MTVGLLQARGGDAPPPLGPLFDLTTEDGLSNLTTEDGLSVLQSYNPGDPWITVDGRLNAPFGVPQYPHLLDNYFPSGGSAGRVRTVGGSYGVLDPDRRQPPWMVAGVDYWVGCPQNQNFNVETYPGGPIGKYAIKSDFSGWHPNFLDFLAHNGWTSFFTDYFPYARFDGLSNDVWDGWDLRHMGFYYVNSTEFHTFRNCLMGGPAGTTNWQNSFAAAGSGILRGCNGLLVTKCTLDCGNYPVNYPRSDPKFGGVYRHLDGSADATHPFEVSYCWLKGSPGQFFSVGNECGIDVVINIHHNFLDEICIDATAVGPVIGAVVSPTNPPWVRITLSGAHGTLPDFIGAGGPQLGVGGIGGVPSANGYWFATFINTVGGNDVYDLRNSDIGSGVYTSAGTWCYHDGSLINHGNYFQSYLAGYQVGPPGGKFYWQWNVSHQSTSHGGEGPQMAGSNTAGAFQDYLECHLDYNTQIVIPLPAGWGFPPFPPNYGNNQLSMAAGFDDTANGPAGTYYNPAYHDKSYTSIGPMSNSNNFLDNTGGGYMLTRSINGDWAQSGYVTIGPTVYMQNGSVGYP